MVETEGPQRFAGYALVLRRLPPQAVHERIPSEDHHVHDGHVERGPHLRGDGGDQFGDLHRSEAGHVHPIDGHDSRCGFVDPADASHHGGLPAPVRADQPDQLPASDVEIYIIEGAESAEVYGQAADGEEIIHRTHAPSSSACMRTPGSRSWRLSLRQGAPEGT